MQKEKINYNKHDLENHAGISAVIKDPNGNILMQEHVKYGFWTIPVGKVLSDQSVEDGLKQELWEECGISISSYKILKQKDFVYNRNGNDVEVKLYVFEILEYTGIVENKEPHKQKQQIFLSIDEIIKLPYLSDMTLLYLQTLGIDRAAKL